MPGRKFLTQQEINALLDSSLEGMHPERNHCLIMMAFLHGFRASELLALRISDLDMKGRILHVARMKNGFSTQHPLLNSEVQSIKRWLRIRRNIISVTEVADEWLFVSNKGHTLSRQQFYKIITSTGKRAKLPLIPSPHMLRHACGYALANNGVDTRLIQDYLGHRNIRHTVRYTAANSARFEGVWKQTDKRKRQQIEPKCHPFRLLYRMYAF